ncbi:uncharacterized protein LOC144174729 [Haemaphysalis longicornis]
MSSRKRAKRDGTCFVPGCKSGYKSCKEKYSIFRTPKDKEKLQQWARNLKRADKDLDDASVMCERHFEPCFIERSFKTVIQGNVVEIPRDVPRLTEDAVPTVFPDASKYVSKPVARKRKERNLCDQPPPPPPKKRHLDAEGSSGVTCSAASHLDDSNCVPDVASEFTELRAPPPWTKVDLGASSDITFAFCHLSDDGALDSLHVSRRVVLSLKSSTGDSVCAAVYIRGKKLRTQELKTAEEAENLLLEVGNLKLCPGCGLKPTSKSFVSSNGSYFSPKCSLTVSSETACVACRYLRRITMNTLSRRKRANNSVTVSGKVNAKKRASKTRALLRAKQKLARVQKVIDDLKVKNEELSKTEFEARISGLPRKQQLAVRTCFEAARQKSTKGFAYTEEWLLECIIMRMRSPKLYEHIRRNNIMALPGRTCLQKRIHNFKSGFGFNPRIFEALSETTKDMDAFSRHGGLVFDEMKISEHLDVKPTGTRTFFCFSGGMYA